MHSFGYRANALLTFAVTILAFICAIASFSDNFSNQNPSAQIQVCLFVNCRDLLLYHGSMCACFTSSCFRSFILLDSGVV